MVYDDNHFSFLFVTARVIVAMASINNMPPIKLHTHQVIGMVKNNFLPEFGSFNIIPSIRLTISPNKPAPIEPSSMINAFLPILITSF